MSGPYPLQHRVTPPHGLEWASGLESGPLHVAALAAATLGSHAPAVGCNKLVVTVLAHIVGQEHGHVLEQLLEGIPRPLVVVVMAAPPDQQVDLAVGVHRPVVEALDDETLDVVQRGEGYFVLEVEVGASQPAHALPVDGDFFVVA